MSTEPLVADAKVYLLEMAHSHNDEIQMLAEPLVADARINVHSIDENCRRSPVSGVSAN